MEYFSTNGKAPAASLRKAVTKGLAEDRGLYMPQYIPRLDSSFFDSFAEKSFHEVAFAVAEAFFGDDIPAAELKRIVCDTLSFDCPVVEVEKDIYSLELFHGPTLAFKDVGARFMARMLAYFRSPETALVNVLVATSGDTGSAVANGFLGVEGINVYVLYPKGKVSPLQEAQFTTLGRNVTALEIDGSFDDCQALVKSAFMDDCLCSKGTFTSANSINVARFLPQSFYYFRACAQLRAKGIDKDIVISVPSGNFGNICSALFGAKMGLPVKRFIAANNSNDVFFKYLQTGIYEPKASVRTLANAMDVGDPSNFARILSLYGNSWEAVRGDISGAVVDDAEIEKTIRECYSSNSYLLDPHGACAYRALKDSLKDGEVGVFCETAHPAKFVETVSGIVGSEVVIPERLAAFARGVKKSVPLPSDYESFRKYMLKQL